MLQSCQPHTEITSQKVLYQWNPILDCMVLAAKNNAYPLQIQKKDQTLKTCTSTQTQ